MLGCVGKKTSVTLFKMSTFLFTKIENLISFYCDMFLKTDFSQGQAKQQYTYRLL